MTAFAADDIETGIARGEFDVWYQPQVDAATLRVAAVEALARWSHPALGRLTPDAFLGYDCDVSLMVSNFVLQRACAQARDWGNVVIAVNAPPCAFGHATFIDLLDAAASAGGLPPQRLEIEVLETKPFENVAAAREIMERIRARGMRLAIDDLGMGFSADALIAGLPVNKIKIARELVTSARAAQIVPEVVRLAHALGIEVTAEGVETEVDAKAMREAGCDYLQGYLFSRPVPAEGIPALIAASL